MSHIIFRIREKKCFKRYLLIMSSVNIFALLHLMLWVVTVYENNNMHAWVMALYHSL